MKKLIFDVVLVLVALAAIIYAPIRRAWRFVNPLRKRYRD
jgi:hypothetical protein